MHTALNDLATRVALMDRLDPVLPEPCDRKSALVAWATAACETQGLARTPQDIEMAVNECLIQKTEPPKNECRLFQAGWSRPLTMKALTQQRRFWTGRIGRFLISDAQHEGVTSGMTLVGIGGAISSYGLLRLSDIHRAAPSTVGMVALTGLLLGMLFCIGLGALTVKILRLKRLGPIILRRAEAFDEAIPTIAQREAWLSNPAARTRVAQCLASDVPVLLEGDTRVLTHLMSVAEKEREEALGEANLNKLRHDLKKSFLPFHPEISS